MGKMGAGELNYSSDIDLIVFFDPEATTLADVEAQPFFVKVAQGLSRILQQRTATVMFSGSIWGCARSVLDADCDLRDAALYYYEREGRTWERAAMIKARACAGDLAAGQAMLADIAPFVWRRHLDFAAVTDVHDMKRQMQTIGPERARGRGT